MNEKDGVQRTVEVLKASLPDDVTIRTEGGGEFMELPAVIVSWSSRRIDRLEGNIPLAGFERDENGHVISEVIHTYHEMRLSLWAKTYDNEPIRMTEDEHWGEEGRDDLVDMLHEAFVWFELYPEEFHVDSFEWQVGDVNADSVPTEEPNWFQADQTVTFRYVKQHENDNVDVIESIERNVSGEI